MEYKKDLKSEIKINKAQLILGILIILVAILWIPIRIFENEGIRFFDWFFTIFQTFWGIYLIYTGWKQYYGKASVLLNDNVIIIKNRLFTTEVN